MNYDFRLTQKGIKRIYYFGNPIFGSLQSAIFITVILALFYKFVLVKNILFLQEQKELGIYAFVITFIISFVLLYKKRRYIQWDERNIRFKNINGYTAIVGVYKIESIKIEAGKGIHVTHSCFYDEKMNGTYLIPFDNLGRNYNVDVNIITEDFKRLYQKLITE